MDDAKADIVGLSDWASARTLRRVAGLTDDELHWEPVPGCWGVRRSAGGGVVVDGADSGDDDPPFTTIAWRLWHLVGVYGAARNARWLGVDVPAPDDLQPAAPAPVTAADAVARLGRAVDHWSAVLDAVTEDQLGQPIGRIGGPYAASTKAAFVLHQLDEAIHHGAELGVVRDLYRWSAR